MRQTTLDKYLGRDPPRARVSFLNLPYLVRHRIYMYIGLIRFCPINLNVEGVNRGQVSDDPYIMNLADVTDFCNYQAKRFPGYIAPSGLDGLGCACILIPYRLLYVCQTIYYECRMILYSENHFWVSRIDLLGLSPFLHLRPTTLTLITKLTIHLNICPCISAPSRQQRHHRYGQIYHGCTEGRMCHWARVLTLLINQFSGAGTGSVAILPCIHRRSISASQLSATLRICNWRRQLLPLFNCFNLSS